MLSVIYLVSYLALSLPAIIAGVVVVGTGSLEFTARGYGIAVILLPPWPLPDSLVGAAFKPLR